MDPLSLILQQGVQGKNVFKLSKVPQNQLLNWLGMLTQCNIIKTLVLLLTTWNRFVVLDIGQSMSDRWKTCYHLENTAMWKGSWSDKLCDVETDLVCLKTRARRAIQCVETEPPKSVSLLQSSSLVSENSSAKSIFLFSVSLFRRIHSHILWWTNSTMNSLSLILWLNMQSEIQVFCFV